MNQPRLAPPPAFVALGAVRRRGLPAAGILAACSVTATAAAQPATSPPGEQQGGVSVTAPAGGSLTFTVEGGGVVLGGGDAEPVSIQLSFGDWFMPLTSPPGLLEVAALLRPEFIRRDLELLVTRLTLDADQAAIAESLLEDYAAAFSLAAEPFNDALRRFRRQETDRTLARMLEGQDQGVGEGLPEGAQVFVIGGDGSGGLPGGGGGGGMVAIGITMVASEDGDAEPELENAPEAPRPRRTLLDRVKERLADAERAGDVVRADELVRLARELQTEREILRAEFIELLRLVAEAEPTDSGADRLAAVLRAITVERERPHGRLAGESLHLEAVLARTLPIEAEAAAAAADRLEERAADLAAALSARARTTLDRELAGLAARAERDRLAEAGGDPAADGSRPPAFRRFVAAAERELESHLAVRSLQLAAMESAGAAIAATDPDAAERFAAAGRRDAFPAETRPAWAERAIAAAAGLEDLAPEVVDAIEAAREQIRPDVRELQDRRIAWRLEQEPSFMRRTLAAMLEDDAEPGIAWGMPEDLRERQVRIDASVEAQLAAILRPEQSASLPPRGGGAGAAGSVLTVTPGRPTDS